MKRRVTIVYECGAPKWIFQPEKMSDKEWEEIAAVMPNGLPCDLLNDGGGVPGQWCVGQCNWGVKPEVEYDEVEES